VLVVDNASKDDTPRFLREAAKQYPNLELILNTDNKGFAGGNNQGLERATGDFLVLLNNDTAVSRGWLSSLSRHLLADRQIGLIGPVTNEIGNEAKIPVGYGDLAAMPVWAARFTAANDGRLLPMPSLAMFCLAMRRDVWERLGPLDESFGTGMFEDDDYALRARELGLLTVCTNDAFVHHAGRASFRKLSDKAYQELFDRNRDLFEAKWGAWHPHLSREDRAEARRLVEELRRGRTAGSGRTAPVLLVLSAGRNQAVADHLAAVACAAAAKGWSVVFDRSGSPESARASLLPEAARIKRYTGAEDLLPELEPDVIWATPVSAVSVRQFDSSRVVYDVSAGAPGASEATSPLFRAHERLLLEATRVVASRESDLGLVGCSPRSVVIPDETLAKDVPELLDRITRNVRKTAALY
jgi:hypothetical protein